MQRLLFYVAIALLLFSTLAITAHAQVVFPNRGGTGTSSAPSYGQVLVGNNGGTYTLTATSSLSIEGDGLGTTTDPLTVTRFVATSTSATSTLPRLSLTTAFDFLGDYITNVTTWIRGKIDAYLTGGEGITYSSGALSFDCSEVEGTGINCTGEDITLDATSPLTWTGEHAFNATTTLATTTASMLNGVIIVDGVSYPQTGAGIQRAWDDCAALTSCGEVFVPNGAYTSTAALDLSGVSSTTLRFESWNAKLVASSGSHNLIASINSLGNETTGIKIVDAFIEGAGTGVSGNGINFEYTDNVILENVYVTDTGTGDDGAGLYFNYVDDAVLVGGVLDGNINGYFSPQNTAPVTTNVRFINTISRNNVDDGFHPQRDYNTTFVGCVAHSNGESGIDLWDSLYPTVDSCSSYSNTLRGIEIADGTSYGTFIGNVFRNNTQDGIFLGATKSTHDNTIDGNSITGNLQNGIEVSSWAIDNVISNNVIRSNGSDANNFNGVHFTAPSAHSNLLSANKINYNAKYGIWTQSGVNNNTLFANDVSGNGTANFINSGGGLLLESIATSTERRFIIKATSTTPIFEVQQYDGTRAFSVDHSGNSTTTGALVAQSTLTASGLITAPSFSATTASATSTLLGGFTVDTNTFVVDHALSRVGIGTLLPLAQFHVSGANNPRLVFQETTGDANDTFTLAFKTTNNTADQFAKGAIIWEDDGTSLARGSLHLAVDTAADSGNAGVADAKLTISSLGNTGIATTSPFRTLSVGGDGWFDGDLRVVGTLDSSDIAFNNLDGERIWTITEGDRVREGADDLVFVNQDGENVLVIHQDGTFTGMKRAPEERGFALSWLGLLGLLGLIPFRRFL